MSELDGDGLGPELRALLEVESQRPAPDEAVQGRVMKRLEVSLFSVAGGVAASTTLSKGGLASAKLWLAGSLAGLVVGGAMVVYLLAGPTRRTAMELTPQAPLVEPLVVVSEPMGAGPEAPPPEPARVDAGVAMPGPVRMPVVAPKPLAGERLLIETARSGLARKKLTEADAALAEHLRRFPDGALAEERDALSVTLLIAEGKVDEADQATHAFRARYPNSLLLRQTPWPGGFKR